MTDEQRPQTPPRAPLKEPGQLHRGFRSSRRSTRAGKADRREVKAFHFKLRAARNTREAVIWAIGAVIGIAIAVVALMFLADGINAAVRWAIQRSGPATAADIRAQRARENLLIIGVKDGRATGFIATRIELEKRKITGISIPGDAFVEVPGQGFEAIADSFDGGGDLSKTTLSNYLGVPFERYIVIDDAAFQAALTSQSLAGLREAVTASDMDDRALSVVTSQLDAVGSADTAIVPLPVKPISIGSEKFLQPQKAEVAELLNKWWGIVPDATGRKRVILFNGAGVPGIAGAAAKRLIADGFTVVDTKNADRFNYPTTQIIVYGDANDTAVAVRQSLGVGVIRKGKADQGLTDVSVIVGRDFKPTKKK